MSSVTTGSASAGSSRPGWFNGAVVYDFCRQQPMGVLGALIIATMILAGLLAEWVAPHDPVAVDFAAVLAPPSLEHPAGTDSFGRDIFSRLIFGARTAMIISLIAALAGCTAGAFLGAASAYFGGRVDAVIQRGVDIFLSFPIIVLALIVVSVLGRQPVLGFDLNLIVAIALPMIPKVARVLRAAALTVVVMPYVDAARALGYSHRRILVRHIAPNLMAPYLIMLTSYIAQAILLEASLSYLGLGVTEPTPAWGLMMSGSAADSFKEAPWVVVFPGLAISLAVFAFNLYGDALRDWLDPRFKV
ncbi:MAG TPA: ABC transporter permease [Azospirillum sp.]|nr:ABC transporter permease [Azospirillum sp.]